MAPIFDRVHFWQTLRPRLQKGLGVGTYGDSNVQGVTRKFVGIHIHHYFLSFASKTLWVVGRDDVVQATTNADQAIAVLYCKIRRPCSHHTWSPHIQIVLPRQCIRRIPRKGARNAQLFCNFSKKIRRAGNANAVTNQKQGSFGVFDQRVDLFNLFAQIDRRCWHLWWDKRRKIFGINRGCLNIKRHVQPDWTIASIFHVPKGFFETTTNVLRPINGHRIFGDRLDQRDDVNFLNTPLPNRTTIDGIGPLDLTRNNEQRQRLDPCAGYRGDQVGGAWSGGHHSNTKTNSVHAAIGLRRNAASLLMMTWHGDQPLFAGNGIVQVHRPAPRQKKNIPNTLVTKALHDVVGNTNFIGKHANQPIQ